MLATITPCQYLFDQEASALFPQQDASFVNASLEETMKIVDHLVRTRSDAFFLFDPTAFNNQCHLYALFVAQVVHTSPERIDQRFLYLSFFLSYAFLTDPKLLEKIACTTLKTMGAKEPTKEFRRFLKDPGNLRTHAARNALNALFAKHLKQIFSSEENPLYAELKMIADADLQLAPSSGKGTLYTFPKFSGVAYFIDAVEKEKIAFLFKVKVITKQGTGSFVHANENLQTLAPTAPVVVFEMVATGEGLSYVECRDIAKQCPSHSRRHVSSKDRHDPTKPCLFCSPQRVNVVPYQKKLEKMLSQSDKMFLSLGADFVRHYQASFLPFFSDSERFPQLTSLFERSALQVKEYGLSMTEPLNMSVSHVYTDCAERALAPDLIIDASYETHLQRRDLI